MSVSIRLSRGGAKKRPYYRIVVADSRASRDGKYLEQIGTYNPLLPKDSGERVKLNEDRARYWLGVGAQATDRVARFLDAAGVKERAARNNPNKAEPGEKAKERVEEKAAKATAAEEARQAAEEEAKNAPAPEPVEEGPAEEATAEAPAEETAAEAAPEEAAAEPAAEEAPAEEAAAEEAPAAAEAEEAPAADAAAEEATAEEAPAAEDAGEEKAEG